MDIYIYTYRCRYIYGRIAYHPALIEAARHGLHQLGAPHVKYRSIDTYICKILIDRFNPALVEPARHGLYQLRSPGVQPWVVHGLLERDAVRIDIGVYIGIYNIDVGI